MQLWPRHQGMERVRRARRTTIEPAMRIPKGWVVVSITPVRGRSGSDHWGATLCPRRLSGEAMPTVTAAPLSGEDLLIGL